MKIAVVENENQKASSIFEPGFIAIYEEDGGEWKVLTRFENQVCNAKGMAAVRASVADTIKQLGDVKVIVASEIPGIASGTFQAASFDIFLVEGNVLDLLDSIKKEMLETIEERQKEPPKFDITQFLEPGVNKGDFSINIEDIMFKNPDLTSKKILIPYLKNGEFNRLDVICSHIPKWFVTNLGSMGFEYEIVNDLPNRKTVRVVRMQTSSSK
ncbi:MULTISPECIES: Fe-only nitrogenase accessory protein AnfO [Methanosarcina]|uniref:AnfO protein, required for Mo-and V-independent nitrogenase n=3 Tax=Methanosarcina barkeri TaxID=2208 RepID=A0A0E3QVP6_METBA|nr:MULTISPECIES: Fe-only nitrogenase accessory protein AnfO [Methanosarcina]AKB54832.1 AnfO protein, required for Mo- and V-independent nitrogenase [Methanosarcina barkeri MS]AKB57091.1 AnfO protein, required for Mo- and V-independent nitrogenase [Methanosarcina barkeri 227]AKJ37657.1 Fe-only nitrogenase accessory protein AnfO [Methanosarcina barkeri CM1]OEC96416.1 Fe-only nitrogenase accessory protein AnfO [Methanosarcina sp. A14]